MILMQCKLKRCHETNCMKICTVQDKVKKNWTEQWMCCDIYNLAGTKYWKFLLLLPFYIPELVKSLSFHIPEDWKRYPFWVEPPRIGHYREYPPRILPWCHGWNCLLLKAFTHQVTSLLRLWKTREQVTQKLMKALQEWMSQQVCVLFWAMHLVYHQHFDRWPDFK